MGKGKTVTVSRSDLQLLIDTLPALYRLHLNAEHVICEDFCSLQHVIVFNADCVLWSH